MKFHFVPQRPATSDVDKSPKFAFFRFSGTWGGGLKGGGGGGGGGGGIF